jgi:hypothetical protein
MFTPTFGRISRFTDKNNRGVDKLILIGNNITDGFCQCFDSHGPGQLVFGTDGTLFATHGEAASFQDAGTSNRSSSK